MKAFIALLSLAAAACVAGGAWLLLVAWGLFHQPDGYAPATSSMPGYTAGGVEADGGGLFLPGWLALAVGVFLGWFAFSLWRACRAERAQRAQGWSDAAARRDARRRRKKHQRPPP